MSAWSNRLVAAFLACLSGVGAALASCQLTPLDTSEAAIGELRWHALYELTSDEGIGGLSGLVLDDEADDKPRFTAIADNGLVVTIDPSQGSPCQSGLLYQADGTPFDGKRQSDAEGAHRTAQGVWISFEQRQRIALFEERESGGLQATGKEWRIQPWQGLPRNRGLEALTAWDNRLLVGAESVSLTGSAHRLWRQPQTDSNAKEWAEYRLETQRGFGLVGLDVSPDGHVLALLRFYAPGFGNRIRIEAIAQSAFDQTDQMIRGTLLAEMTPENTSFLDNFEGIASRRAANGETHIWIISDDNFSPTQRTLLGALVWDEAAFTRRLEHGSANKPDRDRNAGNPGG